MTTKEEIGIIIAEHLKKRKNDSSYNECTKKVSLTDKDYIEVYLRDDYIIIDIYLNNGDIWLTYDSGYLGYLEHVWCNFKYKFKANIDKEKELNPKNKEYIAELKNLYKML